MFPFNFEIYFLLILTSSVCGFNIAVDENLMRIITPPADSTSSETSTAERSAGKFFGYQIKSVKGNTSLVIGAPKANGTRLASKPPIGSSTDYKGEIFQCPFSFNPRLTSEGGRDCYKIRDVPETKAGDSLGQKIEMAADEDLIVCASTRRQECGNREFFPGYCYRLKSTTGRWESDPKTIANACPTTQNVDLIFLLDASGSIGYDNFNLVRKWTKEFSRYFRIEDGSTRIGVITYSSKDMTTVEVTLGQFTDQRKFEAAVDAIVYDYGSTYTAAALRTAVGQFSTSDRQKVLILLTDGASSDSNKLSGSADYARSLDILTFAVGVGGANINELRTIATGTTTNERVYFAVNFDALSEIAGQLQTDISTVLEGSSSSADVLNELWNAQYGFSIKQNPAVSRIVDKWVVCVGESIMCMCVGPGDTERVMSYC
ncbi:integrin alpha-X-like [Clavelina lepadiformis]|uniref:integrin alpha-X-like n=1 Tax=Clavelina lepadiformis TaxID=159417 RepID=UPI0040430B4F